MRRKTEPFLLTLASINRRRSEQPFAIGLRQIILVALVMFAGMGTLRAVSFSEVYSFPTPPLSPYAGLILGSDGAFYGTTQYGGGGYYGYGAGTVFRLSLDGKMTVITGFESVSNGLYLPTAPVIQGPDGQLYGEAGPFLFRVSTNGVTTPGYHTFAGTNGSGPNGGLCIGLDGSLYGTTTYTDAHDGYNGGTIFQITTNGTFNKLLDFTGQGTTVNGSEPYCNLTEDSDGNFYGTTWGGGTGGLGTVFKMTPDHQLVTLVSFYGGVVGPVEPFYGGLPKAGVIFGPGHYLYGTAPGGETTNGIGGTVYRLDINGNGLSSLVSFTGSSGGKVGSDPIGGLVADGNGFLYGTTFNGGSNSDAGTIYKVDANGTNGTFTSLFTFNTNNGANPACTLVFGPDGRLYGTTSAGGAYYSRGTAFAISTNGNLSSLYNFGEPPASQASELCLTSDGNYYGTAAAGGQTTNGVFFRLSPFGLYTTLASFNLTNGASPRSGLVQDSNGNFYGTTYAGGANGFGTLFQCTPNGQITTLFSFDATNYGSHPQSKLVWGSDGYLYGTTYDGAAGSGTVFRVNTNGAVTNLVVFSNSNGSHPYADLSLGQDGNLYGSTEAGGANGKGTLFQISLPVGSFSLLTSFNGANGANPESRLVWGPDGYLYGSTRSGGSSTTNGTLFRISTNGTLTTLVNLDFTHNGAQPYAGLLLANDGNFYGTTSAGGSTNNGGTLFSLNTNGTLTTLATFPTAGSTGQNPKSALLQDWDGTFLGTTSIGGGFIGGSTNRGTVYRVSAGLNPLTPPARPSFTSFAYNGGQFVMQLTSTTSAFWPISLQVSSDLATWVTIATNVFATNGNYVVNDPAATNSTHRFYRVSSP